MGQVYLARSDRGRMVAVKVVREELAAQEEFRARFRQEVRAAQRVGGHWTAPVLDADTEAEVPWVATGYVAGPTLQQVVGRDHGALPERSVRILAAGLAHALQDIHAAGIVHRDLKPSNVLVTIDGPRVIDFGIARALETLAGDGLTRTGSLVGSPGFMAPEQVRGDRITPACDVFCLGSVLAYAATGTLPFGTANSGVHALMFRIAQEEPDLSGVPEGIADLVRDCLRKDPAARPTLHHILDRTGADDTVSGGRSHDPWLPNTLVAQLGRHAVKLLDTEDPQTAELERVALAATGSEASTSEGAGPERAGSEGAGSVRLGSEGAGSGCRCGGCRFERPGSGTAAPGQMSPEGQAPGTRSPGGQSPGGQNPGGQNPDMQDLGVQDLGVQNPAVQSPAVQGPGTQNPAVQNPGTQNPAVQNPGAENPVAQNPVLRNPEAQGGAAIEGACPLARPWPRPLPSPWRSRKPSFAKPLPPHPPPKPPRTRPPRPTTPPRRPPRRTITSHGGRRPGGSAPHPEPARPAPGLRLPAAAPPAGRLQPPPPPTAYGYPEQQSPARQLVGWGGQVPYNPYPHNHDVGLGPTPPYGPGPGGEPQGPPRNGRSTALLVVVALIVALGAGGSVYALMKDGGNGSRTRKAGSGGGAATSAAPTTPGPSTGAPSASPSPSATPTGDGAVPSGYLGTWNASIDNDTGHNTRQLTIRQGEGGRSGADPGRGRTRLPLRVQRRPRPRARRREPVGDQRLHRHLGATAFVLQPGFRHRDHPAVRPHAPAREHQHRRETDVHQVGLTTGNSLHGRSS